MTAPTSALPSVDVKKDTVDSIVEEFGVMPAEVSPMRSTVINSASSTRGSPVNRQLA